MAKIISNTIRLRPYEEVIGDLFELETIGEAMFAQIGKIAVILPPEMEQNLRPRLGSKIAILHTDIPGKEYLFRILSDGKPDHGMESAAETVQAIAAETNIPQQHQGGIR